MKAQAIEESIERLRRPLETVLAQAPVNYLTATPASFPESKGIYIITTEDGTIWRAGKTGRTLRERLYNNHLMGTQPGNFRAQLVANGECRDMDTAKNWIRRRCAVRFLAIDDDSLRARVEHFMLAVIAPKICDKNKQT